MSGSSVTDYDMKALFDLFKRDIFQSLLCHHVGIIQGFDSADQTAKVTIAYKRVINGLEVDYPVLVDCPVIVLGNKTKRLEIPISVGDECLVLFNDRDIDNWFDSGQITTVQTARLHSFSDAIALVGLHSKKNSISDWDSTRVSIRNGSTRVGVSSSKVKIQNGSKDLLGVINALVDLVDTLNTKLTVFATTAATDPIAIVTAGAATTLQTDLAAITLQLAAYKLTESGGLLE